MNPDPTWQDELDVEEAMAGPGRVIPSGPVPDGPTDLSTTYLGLTLRTPVVASSSPLTGDLGSLKAIAAAGAGAVVLPSLFEEQLRDEAAALDALDGLGGEANPEAISGYTAPLDDYNDGATRYLALIRDAAAAIDVPVIASLNGVTEGGWTRYARLMADAGASAVELNVYRVAADAQVSGRSVEDETLRLIEAVASSAGVPIAVKLSPYWSSLAHLAPRLVDAGAAGLVLFNRFYQPDIDLETLRVGPHLVLSSSDELRLPLRWCAILHDRVGAASLAATSGVHTPADVLKVLLAGADVAMTTSALLRHGPDHVEVLVDGLRDWMQDRGYASVHELSGSVSQRSVQDPAAFERANYLSTITTYASTFLR
ncbi:MAG: dihydroorotate dehydrogenase-like protein [Nitriliruptoraceae bacterium]|nr:dihydroorotate dehydrogenase-like protein [Nitriliruptoraceae bacterium]